MRAQLPQTFVLATILAFAVFIVGSRSGSAAYYVYQPPYGWHRVAHTAKGLGVWMHPGDQGYNQNISVLAEHYGGSLSEYTKLAVSQIQSQLPGVQIGAVQRATVCGSHPSMYITYAATVRGKSLVYEQMATIWQGVAYLATYTRLTTQSSLRDARGSLTTLCGGLPPVHGPATHAGVPTTYASPTTAPAPESTVSRTRPPTSAIRESLARTAGLRAR